MDKKPSMNGLSRDFEYNMLSSILKYRLLTILPISTKQTTNTQLK